jgi:hypothetical protein
MPDPKAPLWIWSGSKQVLASGTLLTFGDQAADFDVSLNNDVARVRFEFLTDGGEVRAQYLTEPASYGAPGAKPPPATVRLQFFNLGYLGGTFADGPIRLGTVGGSSLWILYEVVAIAGRNVGKKIVYTFWEGPSNDQSGSVIGGQPRG